MKNMKRHYAVLDERIMLIPPSKEQMDVDGLPTEEYVNIATDNWYSLVVELDKYDIVSNAQSGLEG